MTIVLKLLACAALVAGLAGPAHAAEPVPAGARAPALPQAGSGVALNLSSAARPIVVRQGETLQAVALRLGTDAGVLARLNNLSPPFAVRPGQVLLAPSTGVAAMLAAPVVAPMKAAPKPSVAKTGGPAVQPRPAPRPVQTAAAASRNRPLPPGISEIDLLPLSKRPGASDPKPAAPVARARIESEVLR